MDLEKAVALSALEAKCRFGSCGLRPCESRHKRTFKAQRVRRPSYCTAPAVLVMLISE
jgi:hypothetical protein